MSIRKQFLPYTASALVMLLMWHAAAGKIRAQCCQSQSPAAQPPAANAGVDGMTVSAPKRSEWIVDAATKVAVEVKRWFEKMTFVGYSTQWSSWCKGIRGGPNSKPCGSSGCGKDGKVRQEQGQDAPQKKCCGQAARTTPSFKENARE